jgi:glycine betaine/choline ABC-type transport system substrate-binding protein
MKRFALLLVLLAVVSACRRGNEGPVRIGSKNFSEQVILGELAAQGLEARGIRVDRRLNLGGTFVCHKAIAAGELDLYPEYTGTAFTAILTRKPVSDPKRVFDEVAREYARRWNLVWAPALGFENTFALVMRGDDARRLGIRKISDLAAHPEIRPGFGYEFLEREDGFPGLAKAYGLHFRERPVQMDLGLIYPALESRKVDLVAGNSTDGLIDAIGGVVLEDDKRYFPPYEAAFVVRGEVWEKRPAVREFFQSLAGSLDATAMRKLNAAVDKDKRRPEDVAKEFLKSVIPGKRLPKGSGVHLGIF